MSKKQQNNQAQQQQRGAGVQKPQDGGFPEDELKEVVQGLVDSGASVRLGVGPFGRGLVTTNAATEGAGVPPILEGSAPLAPGPGTWPVPLPADDGAGPVLVVITRMASGRHVRCRLAGTDRMNLVCDVRKAENFRKDMEIRGAVLQAGTEGRVWKYGGVLPRRFGKW